VPGTFSFYTCSAFSNTVAIPIALSWLAARCCTVMCYAVVSVRARKHSARTK